MTRKAEVYKGRSQQLLRKAQLKKWYWFRLVGDNGEPVGRGEEYTAKQSALKTLKKYHPDFEVVDLTGE